MSLLASKTYDPATIATKACSAALAMTALDTTNLRNVFVAPANGAVLVHLSGAVHGGSAAPWYPSILLGVMEGATIRGRYAADGNVQGVAAATGPIMGVSAIFVVSGLTGGTTYTWDAAYGVETIATNAALKYGGPNDTTAQNAFGAFVFEIWDTA